LDSDGDPNNNGITISANILAELKAKNITKLPTNEDEVAVIYEIIKNVDGYQGVFKTEAEAEQHLNGSDSDTPSQEDPSDINYTQRSHTKPNFFSVNTKKHDTRG
jgi:hypothetical protein